MLLVLPVCGLHSLWPVSVSVNLSNDKVTEGDDSQSQNVEHLKTP